MAAKTATSAPAAGDGKSQMSTQIMQHLAALSTKLDDLAKTVGELKTAVSNNSEGMKTMGVALVDMKNAVENIGTQVKTAAGAKRAPKAPGTGTGDGSAASSSVPSGEKFASTSVIWFGQEYKKNPDNMRSKYFTAEQITKVQNQLNGTAAYTKIDVTKGTPEQQAKAKTERAILEAKQFLAELKGDKNKVDRLMDDWRAAKSAWEKEHRTPAKKEGDAPAPTASDAS